MSIHVDTSITNITVHSSVLDEAQIMQALADAVIKTMAVPPTGAVTHEVKFTPNLVQGSDVLHIASAAVTVTVNHVLPADPARVMSVTRRQAMQALILAGLDAKVQAVIDAIPDAKQRKLMQSWYDDSLVFERDRAELTALATQLGLDDAALDALFLQASQL